MDEVSTLKHLYISGLKLLAPHTLEETYTVIGQEAINIVGGDESRIILKTGQHLKTVFDSSKTLRQIKLRKNGYTSTALTENKAFVVNAKSMGHVHPELSQEGIKSGIFIPLGFEDNVIGVLIVRSQQKTTFTDRDLELLKLFGSMASMAIQKTQAYEETQEALDKRDLFIGMAAHELRSPLTPLRIYSQILESMLATGKIPPANIGAKLVEEVSRLTKLVNELLQVKQISKGKLQYTFETCYLQEITTAAIKNFQFAHPERYIHFVNTIADNSDALYGDFDKLLQVMTNILNNAAKYSPETSTISVYLDKYDHHFSLRVKDEGIGIGKKDLPHIFSEFYRGKDSQADGMGLGLFLTKKIITKHKGKIMIESKKHRGTEVTITLPIHL